MPATQRRSSQDTTPPTAEPARVLMLLGAFALVCVATMFILARLT